MRHMFTQVPMLTGYAGVARVEVSLPFVAELVDGEKYYMEPRRLEGTELRRHRSRGPTLRSLVKLALACDNAEQMPTPASRPSSSTFSAKPAASRHAPASKNEHPYRRTAQRDKPDHRNTDENVVSVHSPPHAYASTGKNSTQNARNSIQNIAALPIRRLEKSAHTQSVLHHTLICIKFPGARKTGTKTQITGAP